MAIIRCAKGVTTGYEDGLDRAYERAGQRIARQLTGRRPQRAEMSAQGSPARNALGVSGAGRKPISNRQIG